MTARRIVAIAIGVVVLAVLLGYLTRAPEPRADNAVDRERQAHEEALKSLKETQDEVNMLKAHGVK